MKSALFPRLLARGAVISIALVVVLLGLGLTQAHAADLRGGETLTIGADEVVADDVYGGGGTVSVLGSVQGDLVAGGGTVVVQGAVLQDLIVGGGNVTLLGTVGDDLRVAGGNITIGGNVAGDVIAMGGNIHLLQGAIISGDVIVLGGAITIDSSVAGDVLVRGGQLTMSGEVRGDIDAQVEDLTFESSANIAGAVTYSATKEATIKDSADIAGAIDYTPIETSATQVDTAGVAAFFGFLAFIKFIGFLILALLGLWLFKPFFTDVAKRVVARPGMSALLGFVMLVATPIAILLSYITILGIFVGGTLALAYGLTLMIAGALAMPLAGAILARLIRKEIIVDWKWTLLGALSVCILTFIPFLGWLTIFVVYLMALGALVKALYEKYQK